MLDSAKELIFYRMSWPNGAMRCDVMPTISEDGDQSIMDEHGSHDANIEQVNAPHMST